MIAASRGAPMRRIRSRDSVASAWNQLTASDGLLSYTRCQCSRSDMTTFSVLRCDPLPTKGVNGTLTP